MSWEMTLAVFPFLEAQLSVDAITVLNQILLGLDLVSSKISQGLRLRTSGEKSPKQRLMSK